MLDLIWDVFQHGQIKDLKGKNEISSARHEMHDVKSLDFSKRLRELEQRHEQLKLITLSLWSLLRDHSGLIESDLRKYIQDIDLLDGRQDGKIAMKREKINCPECKRIYLTTALVCPYCGSFNNTKNPFTGA
jgi:hypothetical protein